MIWEPFQTLHLEAGCDEAGRGALVGDLFGAAVILPSDFFDPELDDSKRLTPRKRERLRLLIEREAISWGVGRVSAEIVDEINVLNAAHLSMTQALEQLSPEAGFILVDGNLFRTHLTTPYECIVKGDSKYSSIAAASILAKTHRDEYMISLADQYPQYNWSGNKGYGTLNHRQAIQRYGLTPYHRKSFCKNLL